MVDLGGYNIKGNRLGTSTNRASFVDNYVKKFYPLPGIQVDPIRGGTNPPPVAELKNIANYVYNQGQLTQDYYGEFNSDYDKLISGRVSAEEIPALLQRLRESSKLAQQNRGAYQNVFENVYNPREATRFGTQSSSVPQLDQTELNTVFTLPEHTWSMSDQELLNWISDHERKAGSDWFGGNLAWAVGPSLIGGAALSGLAGAAGIGGFTNPFTSISNAITGGATGGNVASGINLSNLSSGGGSMGIDFSDFLGGPGINLTSGIGNFLGSNTLGQAVGGSIGNMIGGGSSSGGIFDSIKNIFSGSTSDTLRTISNAIGAASNIYQGIQGLNNLGRSPNQAQQSADPYSIYRVQAASDLNRLMSNPSLVYSLPGYNFAQQEAARNIQRQAAAVGGLSSGATVAALTREAPRIAQNWFDSYVQNLASLAGATQSPSVGVNAARTAAQDQSLAQKTALDTLMRGVASVPGFFSS